MHSKIVHADMADLPVVYQLFEEAISFQQNNHYTGWKEIDRNNIQADIQNGLLFKIINDDLIAGIFSVCYTDPFIWREKEKQDALYLHRIVANRRVSGEKVFARVLHWAIDNARSKSLKYVRMDTWADNTKMISYYRSYGFSFIEDYTTPDTENLPVQHRSLKVALLEYAV